MIEIVIGSQAPDFRLSAVGGNIQLSDYRGKTVVLYFYPRDNTPGWTDQAREFREKYADYAAHDAVILGVSRDSILSHEKFASKLQLPFPLLSDPDGAVCELYNVLKAKNMYGKKVIGIERSTFVINASGIVSHVYRKVKLAVAGHAETVFSAIQQVKQ